MASQSTREDKAFDKVRPYNCKQTVYGVQSDCLRSEINVFTFCNKFVYDSDEQKY